MVSVAAAILLGIKMKLTNKMAHISVTIDLVNEVTMVHLVISIHQLLLTFELSNDDCFLEVTMKIKLCPRKAHTCVRPLLRCRDLDINPMTLKHKSDLDILKMYLYTENEVAG